MYIYIQAWMDYLVGMATLDILVRKEILVEMDSLGLKVYTVCYSCKHTR